MDWIEKLGEGWSIKSRELLNLIFQSEWNHPFPLHWINIISAQYTYCAHVIQNHDLGWAKAGRFEKIWSIWDRLESFQANVIGRQRKRNTAEGQFRFLILADWTLAISGKLLQGNMCAVGRSKNFGISMRRGHFRSALGCFALMTWTFLNLIAVIKWEQTGLYLMSAPFAKPKIDICNIKQRLYRSFNWSSKKNMSEQKVVEINARKVIHPSFGRCCYIHNINFLTLVLRNSSYLHSVVKVIIMKMIILVLMMKTFCGKADTR